MLRAVLALGLLAASSFGHGGSFRPPPGGRPGDPFGGGGAPPVSTSPGGDAEPIASWKVWWVLNRGPYLLLRQRIRDRTVITGRKAGSGADVFDRAAVREQLLPIMREALGDEDEEVRTSAAVALGKFGAKEAIPALLERFRRDKIKQVRESCMLGLMIMREPSLKPTFREIVADAKEDRRIRGFAMLGLGFLKDRAFLLRAIQRKGHGLRGSRPSLAELQTVASLALGFCDPIAPVPPLAALALDENAEPAARGLAGTSLARLGHPLALPEMLQLIRESKGKRVARHGAAIAMGALVKPTDEAVLDLLGKKAQRDRDRGVRTLLAMSLGRIGGPRAATHLAAALRTCDPRERGFYYLALGLTRDEDAGPLLIESFKRSKSADDRAACALGIALADYRKGAEFLREKLERDGANPVFTMHCMVALGILDDRAAVPLIEKILKDRKDPGIRREGAIGLALLKRTAAVPQLLDMMRDASSLHTRGMLAGAIGLVGTEKAVEPLLEIYRDKKRQGEERAIALAALGRIGDPLDIPLLGQLSFDLNPHVGSDAIAEALTIL